MAEKGKDERLDEADKQTRQEIADALNTTPDDERVTKFINDRNSDVFVREAFANQPAAGSDATPAADPAPAVDTYEDPFTGETITVAKPEFGKLTTDEQQELLVDEQREGNTSPSP